MTLSLPFSLEYTNSILTHDVSTSRTPQTKSSLPPRKMRRKRKNPAPRTSLPTKKKKKTEKPVPAPQQKPT